jgi:dihydrolipoamide dehydrogenase
MQEFEIAILGGGPGGYAAALRASHNGFKVALIERGELGGTCLNRGCVPSKAWIAAAETVDHAKLLNSVAVEPFEFAVDFKKMKARHIRIVTQFRKSLETLLTKRCVTIFNGHGRFTSPNTLAIEGDETTEIKFENAIIATGSRAMKLFDLGPEKTLYSSSVFNINHPPKSIIVLGAGAIGCELAGVMARLGVKVTILELMPRILPIEDKDISTQMEREFKKLKVKIVKGVTVELVEETTDGIMAKTEDGQVFTAEKILVSIGRELVTDNIGLAELGVNAGGCGEVVVDDALRARGTENIYAVGDVAGRHMLAYTASNEGVIAADVIAGKSVQTDQKPVPSVVFTIPEIGSVGMTQEQAPDNANVGQFLFRGLARAHSTDEISGFVKVIADGDTDRILGVHMIGPRATDMIHTACVAMAAKMTARDLGSLLFGHPTLAECLLEAAHDVHGESLHK